ncbi:MAG: leucine-rich repeat protein, partial [Lachnospiraceae bacterium]|nr:leucine-rich repeat protein [Lachnospiraceae bacterium]
MALIDKLTAIADAIRAKTGKSDKLTLDQMATEIESIESGGGSASEPYIEYKYTSTNRVLSAVMRGYTFIPYCCFYGQNNITSLEIPNIIKVIENSAFHNCSNLALTELPSGLTSIGSYAF